MQWSNDSHTLFVLDPQAGCPEPLSPGETAGRRLGVCAVDSLSGPAGAFKQKLTVLNNSLSSNALSGDIGERKQNVRVSESFLRDYSEPKIDQKTHAGNHNQTHGPAEAFLAGRNRTFLYECARWSYVCKGDFQQAIPFHARSLELCQVWNLRQNVTAFALHCGHALALAGQVSASLALLEHSVETAELTRAIGRLPVNASKLSEVYWLAGRYEDAQALAVQAYAQAHETQEHGIQAWIARLLGAMHAQGDAPDVEQAEAYYRQALALADELGMRPLVAHCHHGLGTLYATTGQQEQARRELVTAIELAVAGILRDVGD